MEPADGLSERANCGGTVRHRAGLPRRRRPVARQPAWALLGGNSEPAAPHLRLCPLVSSGCKSYGALWQRPGEAQIWVYSGQSENWTWGRGRYRDDPQAGGGDDGMAVMVDANQAYDACEPESWPESLADTGIIWLEEPLTGHDRLEDYAALRATSTVPLPLARQRPRSRIPSMVGREAMDIFQPDLCLVGGLESAAAIAADGGGSLASSWRHTASVWASVWHPRSIGQRRLLQCAGARGRRGSRSTPPRTRRGMRFLPMLRGSSQEERHTLA